MAIEYRTGASALTTEAFIGLARLIWDREYDPARTAAALAATINVGAWSGDRLVGAVRVLSDGYFFSTVPEVMVDPAFRKQGVGQELMRLALDAAPGGVLFLGAQPGNEPFFERAGFRRGPTGYVGRRP
ncbi:MAG: GNAT family N-acetyltransferase [Acidobacteria bacterium]|nr:GNAT family N-acetyltransferase [Acidobacteriota bacterium]